MTGIGGSDNKTLFNFRFDSRQKVQEVSTDESHVYSSSTPEFTSVCTSIEGFVITGDCFGALRIYNDVSKNARCVIDQFKGVSSDSNKKLYPKGNPIIGIDVSVNREWIVWTTPTFLGLLNFDFSHGAQDSWKQGKIEKPYAMKLLLDPEDMQKYKINEDMVNFLPAKFDVGPLFDLSNRNITESHITTYTGNFKVTWNLRKLSLAYKQNEVSYYGRITSLKDNVIDFAPEMGRPQMDESVVVLADCVRHIKFD